MPGTSKMLSAVLGPQIEKEFKLEGHQKTHKKSNRIERCVSRQRQAGSSVCQ